MTAWHALTQFWLHHDLLFTRFGLFRHWVHWNLHHLPWLHVHDWHRWPRLWAWVNVHG